MRALKIQAAIILALALLYGAGGTSALIARGMEINLTAIRALAQDVETWKRTFLLYGVLYIAIGVLVFVAALGIFKAKEWARRLWLGVSVVIFLDLIISLTVERSDIPTVVIYCTTMVIVLFSWVYLRLRKVRNLFQRAT